MAAGILVVLDGFHKYLWRAWVPSRGDGPARRTEVELRAGDRIAAGGAGGGGVRSAGSDRGPGLAVCCDLGAVAARLGAARGGHGGGRPAGGSLIFCLSFACCCR